MSSHPGCTKASDVPAGAEEGTDTDQVLQAQIAREQGHVDTAYRRVAELRAAALAWERRSLAAPRGGTHQSVYERDVTVMAAASRRADLDAAGEGLVFGRLDRADGETLHVGWVGVRTGDLEPLVVDWRAPAAAAFYSATAAAPGGVIRRRTISCGGEIVYGVEDELLDPTAAEALGDSVVGDGAFLAAVSRERGPHMRDIVATIQAEQDAAVRAPDAGALLVTGGPGTGKTAVALHRVAYLMYARRDYYARRGVLVIGPTPVFIDYIRHVLPALGETSVRLASLGELPTASGDLRPGGYDPPAVAAVKGSLAMVELLRSTIAALAAPAADVTLTTRYWGAPLSLSAEELRRRREVVASRPRRSHTAGRAALTNSVLDLAWSTYLATPRVTEAAEATPPEREEFVAAMREDDELGRVLDALWPVLTPYDVLTALRDGRVDVPALAAGLLSGAEIDALAAGWAATAAGLVTAADVALLDELAELLGAAPEEPADRDQDVDVAEPGYAELTTFADRSRRRSRDVAGEVSYRSFAHVVVDEAQDVSPMQWRMLARRGRGASWTIVGDWAQSAWPRVAEVRLALASALGRASVAEVELTTNYRSSTEIAALAARVLAAIDADAVAPKAVRSTGVEPVLMTVPVAEQLGALDAAVTTVLAAVSGTVAVICSHALAEPARDRLGALLAAHPRLTVVDSWSVKGLEYDGAVVLRPEEIVAEGLSGTAGLRSLYVALTRATSALTVISAIGLPALLREQRAA